KGQSWTLRPSGVSLSLRLTYSARFLRNASHRTSTLHADGLSSIGFAFIAVKHPFHQALPAATKRLHLVNSSTSRIFRNHSATTCRRHSLHRLRPESNRLHIRCSEHRSHRVIGFPFLIGVFSSLLLSWRTRPADKGYYIPPVVRRRPPDKLSGLSA